MIILYLSYVKLMPVEQTDTLVVERDEKHTVPSIPRQPPPTTRPSRERRHQSALLLNRPSLG